MLAGLAWRNIWRNPYRTGLALASIAFAGAVAVFLLSLQQGAYGTMKENVLRLVDGFAQIQPIGYADDPDLLKSIEAPNKIAVNLERNPRITSVAPRAETYVIVSNDEQSFGAAAIGVDPRAERLVSTLGSTVTAGRYLNARDNDSIVVGRGLARNLDIAPGSTLTLIGSARDGSVAADNLKVVGVFATGVPELDRQLVELPLGRFQDDFAMSGRANLLSIVGRHLSDVQESLPELRRIAIGRGLTIRDWTDLEPALNDVILLDASFSLLLYISLIIVVVFIILNALLMSVLERTHEFGVLLALGMKPSLIGRMIWIELSLLAGLGAALGIGLGSAITAWTSANGIPFPGAEALFAQWHMPSTLYPQLDWVSALAGPLAIASAIALAGFVPYLRVRSLQPVPAMRAA